MIIISSIDMAQAATISKLFSDATLINTPISADQGERLEAISRNHEMADELLLTDISHLDPKQFNAALLSSRANIALIFIDAATGPGKKNFWAVTLAAIAEIPHIVVVVDNMAKTEFSQGRFENLRSKFSQQESEFTCKSLEIIPVDLGSGDNLQSGSSHMEWYTGPSLIPLLSSLMKQPKPETGHEIRAQISDQFAIYLSWISDSPLLTGRQYEFDNGLEKIRANISTLKYRITSDMTEHQAAKQLFAGQLGYGNLSLEKAIAFDPFKHNRSTGSFTLRDRKTGERVAFGIIKHGLRRATNIRWQALEIDKAARTRSMQQKPFVLWFTGLSASGKSSTASLVEQKLCDMGKHTYLLDGDNVRHGLCRDLGFTDAERVENMRRIAETAKLFVDAGLIILVSFIAPFRSERKAARELFAKNEFLEIYVDTPLEVCETRDPKGLYKKARAGQLENFTGLDSPYEPPETPEISLPGASASPDELAEMVLAEVKKKGLL